jgi:hypothetical protein
MPNTQELDVMWTEQKAIASDGGPQAWFGSAVAVSGTLALVGAKNATVDSRASQGAVYVFRKTGGVWKQVQKLVASDGASGDQFGSSIALMGTTAIITAQLATVNGNFAQGAAYVFALSGKTLVQKQKLVAGHGATYDTFGTSVAFNSTSAFIGAGGANRGGHYVPRLVYVFRFVPSRTGNDWVERQTLDAPDPSDLTSSFGTSIAVSETAVFIGARASTIDGNLGQGSVYAYTESNGSWLLTAKLSADDGAARDNFGVSIATQGTTVLIGSPGVAVDGSISEGAVYRFDQSGEDWLQTQKFIAKGGAAFELFGASVSLSKDVALIGAYATSSYRGAAYVFRNKSGVWTQMQKLVASQGAPGDVFGYYTALDTKTALVGSYGAAVDGNPGQGAAYFFTAPHLGVQPQSSDD